MHSQDVEEPDSKNNCMIDLVQKYDSKRHFPL